MPQIEYIKTLEKKLKSTTKELEINKKILLQNSKMAIMGEMIDAIAHQWQQPLSIISLQSDLLTFFTNEDGFVKVEELMKSQSSIKKQIIHLNNTLNEFRNFFRPNYRIKQLSFNSLLQSIEILLKDELIQNNTTLNIENTENILIYINENDIKHILINLINNAKDEMVNNNIDIDKRTVTITYCINQNKKFEILVKDNGKGISKNIIKDIFKPNFTTKEKKGGTGIGLYLCRQLVNKCNGTIDTYNDNGAVFRVILENNQHKVESTVNRIRHVL